MTRVLAADLGGTRARVALFGGRPGRVPELLASRTYAAREFAGPAAVVERFLAEQGAEAVDAACLGVAGAVHAERAWLTNLGWDVDGLTLRERLGVARLEVLNDLVATALGMAVLTPGDLLDVNPTAAEADGNAVLLGAGTGLGMAVLVWSGDRAMAIPSEGGHVELAARTETEWALHRFLAQRLGGRVSVERVASGTGLRNLYDFLVADGTLRPSAEVARRVELEDPGRVIGEAGLAGACPVCAAALDLFASAFGSFAGDMALVTGARGGVYLAGGVAQRLAPKLGDGTFLRAFLDKGRLSPFVERLPVRVLLRPDTALWGAARRALELAS